MRANIKKNISYNNMDADEKKHLDRISYKNKIGKKKGKSGRSNSPWYTLINKVERRISNKDLTLDFRPNEIHHVKTHSSKINF